MDKDFYDFFCSLFNNEEDKKIIKLMLENKSDDEALELLINFKKAEKNV
jgi:hypothetical protein